MGVWWFILKLLYVVRFSCILSVVGYTFLTIQGKINLGKWDMYLTQLSPLLGFDTVWWITASQGERNGSQKLIFSFIFQCPIQLALAGSLLFGLWYKPSHSFSHCHFLTLKEGYGLIHTLTSFVESKCFAFSIGTYGLHLGLLLQIVG